MNELALFAGAGGGILGGHLLGWRTVCAVEKTPYRREVLLRRQRDGMLPVFPIWDDCRTFDGRPWRGLVDVVSAGFPCQPFSVAGRRHGADDERNGWPWTIRIIREVRPRYAFLENVPGLLSSGYFGTVLGDLAEAGYDAVWTVLGADDVGAPHRRKRLWILAYAAGREDQQREPGGVGEETEERQGIDSSAGSGGEVAHPGQRRGQSDGLCSGRELTRGVGSAWWQTDPADLPDAGQLHEQPEREPVEASDGNSARSSCALWEGAEGRPTQSRVGRLANGVAHRVDRLAALGDGQVPAVAAAAWTTLMDQMRAKR